MIYAAKALGFLLGLGVGSGTRALFQLKAYKTLVFRLGHSWSLAKVSQRSWRLICSSFSGNVTEPTIRKQVITNTSNYIRVSRCRHPNWGRIPK